MDSIKGILIFAFVANWTVAYGSEIHHAVSTGSVEQVKVLLDADPHLVNAPDDQNGSRTPLHLAAGWGRIDIVGLLLDRKANIDAKDKDGQTSLDLALTSAVAMTARTEIVALLVAHHANPNSKDSRGETPLGVAVARGYKDAVEVLVTNGADVNTFSAGWTPLHFALAKNETEIADFLKAHGGIDRVIVRDGQEIHQAASDGDLEKVRALLHSNPELLSVKDKSGMTPLHWSCLMGHRGVVDFLLANKAEINARTDYGMTPLICAASMGHTDVVKFLLANKADVNAKAIEGKTALHIMVVSARKDIVELLLSQGADPNVKDSDGKSPLNLARDKQIAQILRDHGAKN